MFVLSETPEEHRNYELNKCCALDGLNTQNCSEFKKAI